MRDSNEGNEKTLWSVEMGCGSQLFHVEVRNRGLKKNSKHFKSSQKYMSQYIYISWPVKYAKK